MCLASPSCSCQCHHSTSNVSSSIPPSNEYLLFEQVLRQTRQEQQQEHLLDNNQLIQTLKRQHQELLTLYHRQIHINKTDREQQTMQISQNDSQIQTDLPSNTSTRTVNSQVLIIHPHTNDSLIEFGFGFSSKLMEHIQHRISKVQPPIMHVLSIVFLLLFERQVLRYNN